MTPDETRDFLRCLARVVPSFARWRRETLNEQAKANGTTPSVEAGEMTASWARMLADATNDEAADLLDRIEAARVDVPHFGELQKWVKRELSLERKRANPVDHTKMAYAPEPRYRCLPCLDHGVLCVFNPRFANAFREEFAASQEANKNTPKPEVADFIASRLEALGVDVEELPRHLPTRWIIDASKWWRQQGGQSPIYSTVACTCKAGDARREKMVSYDPSRHAIIRGSLYEKSLADWYASPRTNATEWAPAAGEYSDRFN